MQEFIDRFGAKNTKASQAQSMAKKIEKMDKIEPVKNTTPKVKFNFDVEQQSGKVVVTINNIEKSYDDIEIFKKSSGIIEKGDKIALIGANGKGKSTLLRLIFHHDINDPEYEKLNNGSIEYGANVIPAFYAQHQLESLNLDNNIYQELVEVNPKKTEQDIRKICGMFLFSNDDVYKKIRVLSGGEKARVALAKVLFNLTLSISSILEFSILLEV